MNKLFLVVFSISFMLLSCKKEKVTPKIIKKQIEKTIPEIKKKWVAKDSLNNKNTIAFFTEYGKQNPETKVRFKTRLGDFTIKLYNDTPLHRANFIFLSKIGYFNTTCFHRVVPNFIIQGGNSENLETANIRNKYKYYLLPPEFRKQHKHKRGVIAMARDWENNPKKLSTPFEFYFIQNKKGEHHLNNEHTVFGEVINGMHVIDKINAQECDNDEWPYVDINITTEIIKE